MISQKYIEELGFKTIEDFFDYVIESYVNGAISQCKEFIKKLSNKQFLRFFDYLGGCGDNEEDYKTTFVKWRYE